MSEKQTPLVLFCYPPFHDPDMAYLAPPLLATTVESEMPWLRCEVDDLNLRWYDRALGTHRLDHEDDLQHDVQSIINTFRQWDADLSDAVSEPGYRVSYRKLLVPFDWTSAVVVAKELDDPISPLRSSLEPLIVEDSRYANAAVVCMSVGVEDQIVGAVATAALIRSRWPKTPIVWGGNMMTRCGTAFESAPLAQWADRVVGGEGDTRIIDILSGLLDGPSGIGAPITLGTHKAEVIYHQPAIDWNRFSQPVAHFAPEPVVPVLASRRCSWEKCEFCGIFAGWDQGFRTREASAVVDEIEQAASNGHKYFRFVDESLTPRLMTEISNELILRSLDIRWEAYSRFEPALARTRLVDKLFKSGCRQIFFGLENIGELTAEFVNKGSYYKQKNVEGVLARTAAAGILNYLFVLVGIPQTPAFEEQATAEFIAGNDNIDAVAIGSFVVDRLSAIHLDPQMHSKYGVTVFEIGELTTEIGYNPIRSSDTKAAGQERADAYTRAVFAARPDLALTSLMTEEQRLYLADRHGRRFARDYLNLVGDDERRTILREGLERSLSEKVTRELASP